MCMNFTNKMSFLSGLIQKNMMKCSHFRGNTLLDCIRSISTCQCLCKKQPSQLKGKSVTSQKWLSRQMNDPYVKLARYESYRCRSAFKLIEMDDKHRILTPGKVVIDCGAAPGSWTQVAVKKVNALGTDSRKARGRVIGVDIQDMLPVEGATIMEHSDFTIPEIQQKIVQFLSGEKADVVLSDMAPNATGIKDMDHELIIGLCTIALQFSFTVLREKGIFLCKIWQGSEQGKLETALKHFFSSVKVVKPTASRLDSAEVFLLAKEFKGAKGQFNKK